jgi:hypothetical protein
MSARELSRRNTGESGKTHRPRRKTARAANEIETGTSRTVCAHNLSAGLPRRKCPLTAAFGSVPKRKYAAIRVNSRAADVFNKMRRANSVALRRKVARGAAIHRARDAKSGSMRVNGRAACAYRSRAKREHRVSQSHHEGARPESGVLHVHHWVARREVRVGRRELAGWLPIGIGMHRYSCRSHSRPCGTRDRSCGPRARSCGVRARPCGPHAHS